jgi:enamine deaminase RidA (YjgF/YER057c/UK114 family)
MTTPEQERDLNSQIDQALASAESNLATIGSRPLTKDQRATVAQVQSFVRQAKERRKTDLAAARSLAQRADILAQDLSRSLR